MFSANRKGLKRQVLLLLCSALMVMMSGAMAQDVKLSIMRPGYPVEAREFLSAAAAAYQVNHPNVSIEIIDADWSTFHDRIMVWISAGQEPDIYLPGVIQFADLVDMEAIVPLDSLVTAELRNDIPQSVMQTWAIDGVQYGVPGAMTSVSLWYNKELFEQAGLDPEAPPTTWEELVEYGLAITDRTDAYGVGLNLGRFADTMHNLTGVVLSTALGGPLADPAGNPNFNTEAGVAAVQFLDDLVNRYQITQPHPEQYSKADVRLLFRDDKVAMVAEGPWIIGLLNGVTDLSAPETSKFGVAPVPAGPDGKAFTILDGSPWVVSANSKHPEEALDFLEFLISAEWQYAHDSAVHQPPFRQSIWDQKGDEIENAWIYKTMVDQLDRAFMTPVQNGSRFLEIINDSLQMVVLGQSSPAAALDAAAAELQRLYRR